MTPVLVDTGFLVSVYDKRERRHAECLRIHLELPNPIATCEAVIVEALHLLRRVQGAADGILASVNEGVLQIPLRLNESASSIQAILRKYRDTPADFAEACLIHLANQLDTGDILTLDSDFKHYRWRRNRAFNLLIPLD